MEPSFEAFGSLYMLRGLRVEDIPELASFAVFGVCRLDVNQKASCHHGRSCGSGVEGLGHESIDIFSTTKRCIKFLQTLNRKPLIPLNPQTRDL